MRGSALLRPSRVRGSAFARHRAGAGWSPEPSNLDPLLAEAVLLLRASAINPATYADGADWPNEGTGGAALDATPTAADLENIAPAFFWDREGLPPLRFFHPITNETDPVTANRCCVYVDGDDPAFDFPDGMFLAYQGRAIPDADSPGADQSIRISKLNDDEDGAVWQFSQQISTGKVRIAASGIVPGTDNLGPGGDVYALTEVAVGLVAATGAVTAYIRDDDAPDVTVGGRGWRILETVIHGPGTLATSTGDLIVGGGKGWTAYAELYDWDGTTATLVAAFDPADGVAGQKAGSTITSSQADGTVWTLGAQSFILDGSEPGFACSRVDDEGWFAVGDNALIDPDTGDQTVAIRADVLQSATADNSIYLWASKGTGNLGQDLVGWKLPDLHFSGFGIDGAGVGTGDGADFANAFGARWSLGQHIIAFVFDRDGDCIQYVDGVETASPSMTAVGDMSAAVDLLVGALNSSGDTIVLRDVVIWDRVLTPTEIATDLPAALAP